MGGRILGGGVEDLLPGQHLLPPGGEPPSQIDQRLAPLRFEIQGQVACERSLGVVQLLHAAPIRQHREDAAAAIREAGEQPSPGGEPDRLGIGARRRSESAHRLQRLLGDREALFQGLEGAVTRGLQEQRVGCRRRLTPPFPEGPAAFPILPLEKLQLPLRQVGILEPLGRRSAVLSERLGELCDQVAKSRDVARGACQGEYEAVLVHRQLEDMNGEERPRQIDAEPGPGGKAAVDGKAGLVPTHGREVRHRRHEVHRRVDAHDRHRQPRR